MKIEHRKRKSYLIFAKINRVWSWWRSNIPQGFVEIWQFVRMIPRAKIGRKSGKVKNGKPKETSQIWFQIHKINKILGRSCLNMPEKFRQARSIGFRAKCTYGRARAQTHIRTVLTNIIFTRKLISNNQKTILETQFCLIDKNCLRKSLLQGFFFEKATDYTNKKFHNFDLWIMNLINTNFDNDETKILNNITKLNLSQKLKPNLDNLWVVSEQDISFLRLH